MDKNRLIQIANHFDKIGATPSLMNLKINSSEWLLLSIEKEEILEFKQL